MATGGTEKRQIENKIEIESKSKSKKTETENVLSMKFAGVFVQEGGSGKLAASQRAWDALKIIK